MDADSLPALGETCDGIVSELVTLGTEAPVHDARVLLTADDATLVVDALVVGPHLIAVLHEGAPCEAVALLLAEQAALPG